MNILVASDLSARSDRALARGFALAKELNGRLRILHVVDKNLPEALKAHSVEWAKAELARETERLVAETGVNAELVVYAGHPKGEIIRQADPKDTALLILGVHDQSKPHTHTFAHTTAGHALKFSFPPILLVKEDASEPYRQVIIGTDFSIFSRAAIQQATYIAPSASFSLVHAYHAPSKGSAGLNDMSDETGHEERHKFDTFLKEEMRDLVKRIMPRRAVLTSDVNTVLKEGEPCEVLRYECARLNADLLTIATHGRPRASRAIWGSVAVELLDNPPCDVLVIKPY